MTENVDGSSTGNGRLWIESYQVCAMRPKAEASADKEPAVGLILKLGGLTPEPTEVCVRFKTRAAISEFIRELTNCRDHAFPAEAPKGHN